METYGVKICCRCRFTYQNFSLNKKGVLYSVCDTCRANQSNAIRKKIEQKWDRTEEEQQN